METVHLGRGYSAAVAIRVLPETGEQVVVANLGEEGDDGGGPSTAASPPAPSGR